MVNFFLKKNHRSVHQTVKILKFLSICQKKPQVFRKKHAKKKFVLTSTLYFHIPMETFEKGTRSVNACLSMCPLNVNICFFLGNVIFCRTYRGMFQLMRLFAKNQNFCRETHMLRVYVHATAHAHM